MIRLSVHFVTACSSWRIASHETTHTLHFSFRAREIAFSLAPAYFRILTMSATAA